MTRSLGFIGTGTMGRPMAERLLDGGHELIVYDAVSEATSSLVERGAVASTSIPALAASASLIFLSLPGPQQIEEVVGGTDGVKQHAKAGTVIVDLSTNSLDLARRLARSCRDAGVYYIDAPVSGGAAGARKGTLSVLVGVDDDDVWTTVKPYLECIGSKIVRAGPVGAGTLLKLINNQIFLCASVLIQEGFVLGAKAGMSAAELLGVLNDSSAGVYTRKSAFVLDRDFDAELFKLAIAAKDVGLALETAEALGVNMPMTAAAHGVYQAAVEMGYGNNKFSATLRTLEGWAGAEVADPQVRPS